jgi:hypothetical protein
MKDKDKETQPDDAARCPSLPPRVDAGAAPAEDSKPAPPATKPKSYNFKIVKADPKNTLNFEDVADK